MSTIKHESVYLKITDKDGKWFIEEFRTWNKSRFLEKTTKSYAKEGRKVEVATQDEYRTFKNYKGY